MEKEPLHWERLLIRSKNALSAAELLLNKGEKQTFLPDVVSKSYYAMFYAANALLLKHGIIRKKHSAVIAAFGEEFVRKGIIDKEYHQTLVKGFEYRGCADYDIFWDTTLDKTKEILRRATDFVKVVEQTIHSLSS